MSAICGGCGEIIFVSAHKDWVTNKRKPELSCAVCGLKGGVVYEAE